MFIEQPPLLYRALFPGALWKIPDRSEKCVYLTFDDGPIPEVTPWVLDVLDRYQIKATFFMVGENVWRHPDVYRQVLARGHAVGNHTYNHVQGIRYWTRNYIANVRKAAELIPGRLFRPPHGHMRMPQLWALRAMGYKVVMWDVVTRDYSPHLTPRDVLRNVQRFVRNGSIIVFHDSLKAEQNMRWAMPRAVEWLLNEGYSFRLVDSAANLRGVPRKSLWLPAGHVRKVLPEVSANSCSRCLQTPAGGVGEQLPEVSPDICPTCRRIPARGVGGGLGHLFSDSSPRL